MEANRTFTLFDPRFKKIVDQNLTNLLDEHRKQSPRHATVMRASSSTHTIRDNRGHTHSITSNGIDEDVLVSLLAAKGYPVADLKQLARLRDHSDWYVELEVIATIQTYFQFSTERICDVVSMLFERAFVHNSVQSLKRTLEDRLGLVGENGLSNCKKFAKDEPQIEEQRQLLKRQKEILLNARKVIYEFYHSN
jgi:hypothetical protein